MILHHDPVGLPFCESLQLNAFDLMKEFHLAAPLKPIDHDRLSRRHQGLRLCGETCCKCVQIECWVQMDSGNACVIIADAEDAH